jgi:hypothetical protein
LFTRINGGPARTATRGDGVSQPLGFID